MRKHTLIALSAFSALSASAIAGTASSGTFNPSHTHLSPVRFSEPLSKAGSAFFTSIPKESLAHRRRVRLEVTGSSAARAVMAAFVHASVRPSDVVYVYVKAHPKPKPKPRPKPAPAPAPAPAVTTSTAPSGGVWLELRMCESGDNYATNTGNGYYGAYQFSLATWYGLGFTGLPSNASPATQDRAAQELQAEAGWDQWPGCAAALGL